MRCGIVGDLHGNLIEGEYIASEMAARKISHVFVMGDCGLWPGREGHLYLDGMQQLAADHGFTWFFVLGNHDWYDGFEAYQDIYPTHKGFTYIRSNVLAAKTTHFRLDGKTFTVAGGAHSVDKQWRLAKERGGQYFDREMGYSSDVGRGKGPRTLWWWQETLTDDEVAMVKSWGEADYLFTHDCSQFTPFRTNLKPDLDSQIHREKIDGIIAAVKPQLHFHGHMHTAYDWENSQSHGFYSPDEPGAIVTRTIGLEADFSAMRSRAVRPDALNWGTLDIPTGQFAFRGVGMNFRSLSNE